MTVILRAWAPQVSQQQNRRATSYCNTGGFLGQHHILWHHQNVCGSFVRQPCMLPHSVPTHHLGGSLLQKVGGARHLQQVLKGSIKFGVRTARLLRHNRSLLDLLQQRSVQSLRAHCARVSRCAAVAPLVPWGIAAAVPIQLPWLLVLVLVPPAVFLTSCCSLTERLSGWDGGARDGGARDWLAGPDFSISAYEKKSSAWECECDSECCRLDEDLRTGAVCWTVSLRTLKASARVVSGSLHFFSSATWVELHDW